MSLMHILREAMARTHTVPSRTASPDPQIWTTALDRRAETPIKASRRAGDLPHLRRRAGEEGMFFLDVLRMYDKRSTVLKTDALSPAAGCD